jgi:hypothetical protein
MALSFGAYTAFDVAADKAAFMRCVVMAPLFSQGFLECVNPSLFRPYKPRQSTSRCKSI